MVATPKESALQAEILDLRRRNGELQLKVEELIRNVGLAPSSLRMNRSDSSNNDDNGRGVHRRMNHSVSSSTTVVVEAADDNEHKKGLLNRRQQLKRKSSDINAQTLATAHHDEEVGKYSFAEIQLDTSHDLSNNTDDGVTDEESDHLIIDDESHHKNIHRNSSTSGSTTSSASSTAFPPFMDQLKERAGWLIGLLVLQSCSSFIIQNNQRFLQKHMTIVQFLTMLVGAGGNAGNQAAVRVIRGLAVGTLNHRTMKNFLHNEAKMALSLSILIGMTGFARAAVFRVPPGETIAVTASVCAIVAISVAIGNALPLGMRKVGIDPAHSSTTIQVIMDILGVFITVCVSSFVLSFKVFQNEENNRVAASHGPTVDSL
jgi:cation transporter-like permease